MSEKKVIYADPFLNQKPENKNVPEKASYLCTSEVSYGIAEQSEHVYFIRKDSNDELWLEIESWSSSDIGRSGGAVKPNNVLVGAPWRKQY